MKFFFQTDKKTNWGDKLYVVGNDTAFGGWNPKKGIELHTTEETYPMWKSKVYECSNKSVLATLEYKYVVIDTQGNVYWEDGENRTMVNRLTVNNCKFDDLRRFRIAKDIKYTDKNKDYSTIFSALCNQNDVYVKIKGDMQRISKAKIIDKNIRNRRIILEVRNNFIKTNKIQKKYMPYYIIYFDRHEKNIVIDGPLKSI